MITPRHVNLIRTHGLKSFQQTIVELLAESDPWLVRQMAVLVPTVAAGAQLRRTMENHMVESAVVAQVRVVPWLLTRDAWYQEMHARLDGVPPLLTPIERHVCMLGAARQAERSDAPPPFKLRSGLIPSIIGFYDNLMRHRRSVAAFERLVTADLEPSIDLDSGARRLLRQTKFLVSAFRHYEKRLADSDRVDEHGLRLLLTTTAMATPFARVVLTIPDHVVDATGFWPADYDLLSRLPAIERVDVVTTDRLLDSGFYERIIELLPGITERTVRTGHGRLPVLMTPADSESDHFVWRDREEELLAVIRSVKSQQRQPRVVGDSDGSEAVSVGERQVGVVFQRPLPYLYLASHLVQQAGVSFEAFDTLPLAGEPYAAALDLVCSFVTSQYDRSSTLELLRSPHFAFDDGSGVLGPVSVEALDQRLRGVRFAGGRTRLRRLAAEWAISGGGADATAAVGVAARLAHELRSLEKKAPPSSLLKTLGTFLRRYATKRTRPEPLEEQELLTRTAIWTAVDQLTKAHQTLDDTETSFTEVVFMLRRWIESKTCQPRTKAGGIQLVDAQSAPYGRFNDLFVIGLLDGDWPERLRRNVFYPSSLLIQLGWPRERDCLSAARAKFRDLLELPDDQVWLSTVSFENDAITMPSSFLDDVNDSELVRMPTDVDPSVCVTYEDAMAYAALQPGDLSEPASTWLAMRAQDRDRLAPRFRGLVGPREPATYAVRSLEMYLECPFKFFAARVLKLDEESVDNSMEALQRRGLFLHRVFETFFRTWHDDGNHSITIANLGKALKSFSQLAETSLDKLPPEDRAVTRSWMLGSVAAAGLADRLFMLEISRPTDVVERLTEFRVDDNFVLGTGEQRRTVRLRGVADRVDLFSDGTFRVIDYKANRAPSRGLSMQLPLYVRCLEQQLEKRDGRPWRGVEAAFVAFGEPRLYVPLGRRGLAKELAASDHRATEVLDKIEEGDYSVRPAELYRCSYCAYPTVCRKDYVGDE